MRLGEPIPLPVYPEYKQLLDAAREAAREFIDPARLWEPEHVATRRGYDWATAVIGRPWPGLRYVSSVEAKLILIADAADINPPLPQWILDDRAAAAAHQARLLEARAARRQAEEQAWATARDACPVPLEVRENTNSRSYGDRRGSLCHAVPTVDAVSGRARQHPIGRPLCVTATRRPMKLSDPVDDPATCMRCLDWAGKIRPATDEKR